MDLAATSSFFAPAPRPSPAYSPLPRTQPRGAHGACAEPHASPPGGPLAHASTLPAAQLQRAHHHLHPAAAHAASGPQQQQHPRGSGPGLCPASCGPGQEPWGEGRAHPGSGEGWGGGAAWRAGPPPPMPSALPGTGASLANGAPCAAPALVGWPLVEHALQPTELHAPPSGRSHRLRTATSTAAATAAEVHAAGPAAGAWVQGQAAVAAGGPRHKRAPSSSGGGAARVWPPQPHPQGLAGAGAAGAGDGDGGSAYGGGGEGGLGVATREASGTGGDARILRAVASARWGTAVLAAPAHPPPPLPPGPVPARASPTLRLPPVFVSVGPIIEVRVVRVGERWSCGLGGSTWCLD